MITVDMVVKELIENPDYRENLEEILEQYFYDKPKMLKEWQEWFFSLDGKGL